jgi:hypothetical protein
VAYDFFYHKQVPKNIALSSSIDVSTSEPTPTTSEDNAYIARLAVLKMQADSGDKSAKKSWKKELGNLTKIQQKARKGDPHAAHLITVVRESGLFSDVKAMEVSQNRNLTPQAQKLVALLGQLKAKAVSGDPRALNLVATINTLQLNKVPQTVLSGDSEAIEELKLRAEMDDPVAIRRLKLLKASESDLTRDRSSGDAEADRQLAKKMLEDAADAKTIRRSDVKKAITLYAGDQATDKEKTDIGSKILTFLQKKNVQITS